VSSDAIKLYADFQKLMNKNLFSRLELPGAIIGLIFGGSLPAVFTAATYRNTDMESDRVGLEIDNSTAPTHLTNNTVLDTNYGGIYDRDFWTTFGMTAAAGLLLGLGIGHYRHRLSYNNEVISYGETLYNFAGRMTKDHQALASSTGKATSLRIAAAQAGLVGDNAVSYWEFAACVKGIMDQSRSCRYVPV
jgi:hypothetical protein